MNITNCTLPSRFGIRAIKLILVGVVIYYVTSYVIRNLAGLPTDYLGFSARSFALSVIFLVASVISYAAIWQYITVCNSCNIPWEKGITAWFYAELGKYIPGRVLLFAGKLYFYKCEGISPSKVTICFILEQACCLAACMVVFLLGTSATCPPQLTWLHRSAILLLLPTIIAIHPKILQWGSNIILSLFHQSPISIEVSMADVLRITGLYCISFCLIGTGFFFLANALHPIPFRQIPYLIATFACASLVGLLSVFAPSGIGVREGFLIIFLQILMPPGLAGVLSIIARLWTTSADVLISLFCLLWSRRIMTIHKTKQISTVHAAKP